jgi:hypothetical protein
LDFLHLFETPQVQLNLNAVSCLVLQVSFAVEVSGLHDGVDSMSLYSTVTSAKLVVECDQFSENLKTENIAHGAFLHANEPYYQSTSTVLLRPPPVSSKASQQLGRSIRQSPAPLP